MRHRKYYARAANAINTSLNSKTSHTMFFERFKKLYWDGVSWNEIAKQLGLSSKKAAQNLAKELGLPSRAAAEQAVEARPATLRNSDVNSDTRAA